MSQSGPQTRAILSIAIRPKDSDESSRLRQALREIAKEDLAISLGTESADGSFLLSGMSESHLESICDRLSGEHEIGIDIGEPRVIYLETIRKMVEAEGKYIRQTGGSGNYGHCKLRIEPNQPGKGYEFINDLKGDVVPGKYVKPIDEGVQGAAELGILAGYPVVDIKVTLFDGSSHEVDSNEMAFKFAGSIAFKEAARKASPMVLEPVMEIEAEVPDASAGAVIADIASRRGRIEDIEHADGWQLIKAFVPLSEMLSSSNLGCPAYSMRFARYQAVRGDGFSDAGGPGVTANHPKSPPLGRNSAAARLDPESE